MKWRKKKLSPSLSSSRLPSISGVFPFSLLSKFKQMSINPEPKLAKGKSKGEKTAPKYAAGGGNTGRFYSRDGDAFWRLSFGEGGDEKKGRGGVKSVWYESNDELEFPKSTRLVAEEENHKFNMVSDVRSMRELPKDLKIVSQTDAYAKGVEEIRTPRLRNDKDWKLRKIHRAIMEEKLLGAERVWRQTEGKSKAAESVLLEMSPASGIGMIERKDSRLLAAVDSRKHDCVSFVTSKNKAKISEKGKLKEMKVEELKSKSVRQRKSQYISREFQRKRTKQSSKVRVNSPRTATKVEMCKIKAIEDMKRTKLKMRKVKGRGGEGYTSLDSFAVVKCSYDPQKDFRDSMMEMIIEKQISRPEDLEHLLASYLTLNSDKYHDLIIKVFQQVWCDLKQACSDHELLDEQCNYD